MQKWIKPLRRLLGWLVLVLALGFVMLIPVSYIWLQSLWGKQWLTARMENAYSSELKSNLHIGTIEGKLPVRIVLNDILITLDVDSSRVDTVARINKLELSLRFWDLLYGQVQLTSLQIYEPIVQVELLPDSTVNIARAFEPVMPRGEPSNVLVPENFNINAPHVALHDGVILFGEGISGRLIGNITLPSRIDSIEARLFVEINENQRFIDMVTLSAHASGSWIERFTVSGQLFSDARFTELKRFNLQTDRSSLKADVILEGPDINSKGWTNKLEDANWILSIRDSQIHPLDLTPWTQDIPSLKNVAQVELDANGTYADIILDNLDIRHDDTHIVMSGAISNAFSDAPFTFDANVTTLKADFSDIAIFLPNVDTTVVRALSETRMQGDVSGVSDSISVNLTVASPAGDIGVVGGLTWGNAKAYSVKLSSTNLDLGSWATVHIPDTKLNITTFIEGNGFDRYANLAITSNVLESEVWGVGIDTLRVIAGLNTSELQSKIILSSDVGRLTGNLEALLFVDEPKYRLTGAVENMNLSTFSSDSVFPDTDLSADFSLDLFGKEINDLYGRISIDGRASTVGGQLYPPIQAYADLSESSGGSRSLRLTSSYIDAVITGNLIPQNIKRQIDYWTYEIRRQIDNEFLRVGEFKTRRRLLEPAETVSLQYNLSIKQIQTLKRLLPTLPDFETSARIEGTVLADRDRMLLNVSVVDDSMRLADIVATNVDFRLTMALQHGQELGASANVQMTSNLGLLQIGSVELQKIQTRASLLNDSIFVAQTIALIGEGARSSFTIQASLRDSMIAIEFPTFFLGNNQYSWRASGVPKLLVLPEKKIDFADFRFENDNQRIMVKGIYSEDIVDMLELDLVDVDLKSISELVKIRFNFDGIVNGMLQTRSLRTQTNIEGHLEIDAFAINGRVVGDINLESEYNPDLRRFDTIINVKTDSEKYAEYLNNNSGIGQDIELIGYFAPRNLNPDLDHLYNFDVNLNEVDLWIIRFLLLDVFTKVEGKATGSGSIRGDVGNIVYDAAFNVVNAQVIPVFLNTNYALNGDITFNNQDGLVFDNVRVNDDKRGTGILSGNVDMNDFKPEKYLDLRLRLNRLEFLNNSYDPDIPFYGRVSGSGDIRLFGPTTKLFLQTIRPITVTPNSKLIIPLLDETAINQQTNFIRFVNEFFEKSIPILERPTTSVAPFTAQGRNFYDIFQLDLQFNMPQDAAIEFVFDPVTNEYLTTRGTGSVRITLENANLGMFGNFDIDRGEYNFVGGDIFTKKFKIRQGGQVIWDGIAQDPRIEVTAFFSTRPNLAPLGTGRDVRAPIDLILNLNGRIGSLENDFYFAYPATNFDQGLTASELNILNGEDQKLLQATSLLITGNFLPVNTGVQTDVNLQNKMTQAGIGQLLSSQINYLLNSSLSNFDFDLNLTGFDQADLGIGLRLFDDRLELRRDGTIVGEQTNIGDLAATYRINRFFSVEIFHRQDINSTRGLSQEGTVDRVNGVGLQYQVEFSSWKKFLSDIWRALIRSDS